MHSFSFHIHIRQIAPGVSNVKRREVRSVESPSEPRGNVLLLSADCAVGVWLFVCFTINICFTLVFVFPNLVQLWSAWLIALSWRPSIVLLGFLHCSHICGTHLLEASWDSPSPEPLLSWAGIGDPHPLGSFLSLPLQAPASTLLLLCFPWLCAAACYDPCVAVSLACGLDQ